MDSEFCSIAPEPIGSVFSLVSTTDELVYSNYLMTYLAYLGFSTLKLHVFFKLHQTQPPLGTTTGLPDMGIRKGMV